MARSYGLDSRGSISGGARDFIFVTVSKPILRPNQSPMQWVPEAASNGVKRRQREAEHPPPSSAEVKNGEAIPPLPNKSSCCGAELIKQRSNFILPCHPSMLWSPKRYKQYRFFRFSDKYLICISHIFQTCYMSRRSPSWRIVANILS
jgi:hypothetical protein